MIKKLNALKNQKGMTLVELLAVMVIIGIIAAISIPAIGNLIDNARKDAAVATAQSVQDAARLYVTSNNISFDITLYATATSSSDESSEPVNLVTEHFLENAPLDPNKLPYDVAKVEVTFDAAGVVSYETTLSREGGKYNLQGDAFKIDRTNVTSAQHS